MSAGQEGGKERGEQEEEEPTSLTRKSASRAHPVFARQPFTDSQINGRAANEYMP